MLSLFDLGENEEAFRLTDETWPNPAYQKKARIFARVFLMDEPTDLSSDWLGRKRLWSYRYSPEIAARELEAIDLTAAEFAELNALVLTLNQSRKYSPTLMASLSLVPGLGQAVMGDWAAAGISVILNSLFGFASYELFKKELYAPAALSATVFSITYFGGMVQSGRLAASRNDYRSRNTENELRSTLFREILEP
jgi:hypothetical protein